MVDFLSLLPRDRRERLRRRIDAESREMERLHGLPDRWLANEILRLARGIRAAVPDCASPGERGYNNLLLWDVVPEIARRLGAPLIPNESTDYETRTCGPERLREIASSCYQNASRAYLTPAELPDADLCPVSLLLNEAANGNPMAVALDRVAPPQPGYRDFLARHVAEISGHRGHPATTAWHPGLQERRAKEQAASEEEFLFGASTP